MKPDDMYIYIPTLGRVNRQITIGNIPKKWLPKTRIVVMPEEFEELSRRYGNIVVICPNRGLSPTRQWIVDTCPSKYLFMMDDDITFHIRHSGKKLKKCTEEEVDILFETMLNYARSGFAAVGLSVRQDNFFVEEDYKDNSKICSLYVLDTEVLSLHGIKFRLDVMEDYDVILCLLEAGYPNRVVFNYAWSQPSSGAVGGCALFRNDSVQKASAHELARLHPHSVRVVEITSKNAWQGFESNVRTDVKMQWKKAFNLINKKNDGILKFITGNRN